MKKINFYTLTDTVRLTGGYNLSITESDKMQ